MFNGVGSCSETKKDLHAAGQSNITENSSDFTEKLLGMATAMNEGVILSKLSVGDVTANELFYHLTCYSAYKRLYEKHQKESEQPSVKTTDDDYRQAYALNDIITFIIENPVKHKLTDLQNLYNEKPGDNMAEFHYSKTVSGFVEKVHSPTES